MELIKINLEKTGEFEVQNENDSTLALGTTRRFQPDAILLDVVMPGTDRGDVQASSKVTLFSAVFTSLC